MKSALIFLIVFITLLVQFLTVLPKPVYASTPYTASDVLGQEDFVSRYSDDAYPTSTGMSNPAGTTVDEVGHRLFVSDRSNNRVLVFNLDNNNLLIDSEADFVLGQNNFSDGGYALSQNSLRSPGSLAYDSTNNILFVEDASNNRILVFDVASITNGESAVKVLCQPDFSTSVSGVASQSSTSYIAGIEFDHANNRLFVTDYGASRVLVFDTTTLTNGEAAVNVLGQSDFTSDATDTNQKGFMWPVSVAIDESNHLLYVSDSGNNRILVFDSSILATNMDASYVLGQPDFTSTGSDANAKGFNYSNAMTIDEPNQLLYVSDSGNNRILIFDTSVLATNMDASYVLGQSDYISSSEDTTVKGFSTPNGPTILSNGLLYVSDSGNHRVLVFDTTILSNNMDAIEVAGQSDFTSSKINGHTTPNSSGVSPFLGMSTLLDSVNHRLFVSDGDNHRILVFNLNSNNGFIDKIADYVLGQPDFNSSTYGSDSDSLGDPGQLAYDSLNNYLFVTDSQRVLVYDVSSITNGEAAIRVLGSADINSGGAGGHNANTFEGGYYGGIAYDAVHKQLFVNDISTNCRIMVFDLSSGISNGMDAVRVLGAADTSSQGSCDLTASSMAASYGDSLAIDEERSLLFVALDSQDRVLVFDIANITDNEPAVHVIGQPDYLTSGENITQDGLSDPLGLTFDPDNNYLFVNQYVGRISVFDTSNITDGMDAIGVLGSVSDFASAGDNWIASQVDVYGYEQSNMTFDTLNRRLFVAEDGNARILIFSFANITNAGLSDGVVGASYSDSVDYTGTQGTVSFAVTTGSLPLGLSLNSSTGEITGTPTTSGSSTFTITLTDDNGAVGTYSDTQEYTVAITGSGGNSPTSTSSPRPDGQSSTTEAPHCNDQVSMAPDLFQVDRSYKSATVHFTPLSDNVSSYLISYGIDTNAEGYSLELPITHSDGVISQTINELNPSSSYYFKVRAQKGCMPGVWSTVKQSNVGGGSVYINSAPQTSPTNSNSKLKTTTIQKKIVKKSTKSTKKTIKPKTTSTSTPKPSKPWYVFW